MRRDVPPARRVVNDGALAVGIEARDLRCDLGLAVHTLAREHQWTTRDWFDAEQGLAGIEKARAVLNIVRDLARARETAPAGGA